MYSHSDGLRAPSKPTEILPPTFSLNFREPEDIFLSVAALAATRAVNVQINGSFRNRTIRSSDRQIKTQNQKAKSKRNSNRIKRGRIHCCFIFLSRTSYPTQNSLICPLLSLSLCPIPNSNGRNSDTPTNYPHGYPQTDYDYFSFTTWWLILKFNLEIQLAVKQTKDFSESVLSIPF